MGVALATWVPPMRPRKTLVSLDGDFEIYAALSPADRLRGQKLRAERMRRGLSLFAASLRLGISIVYLAECERGARAFELAAAIWLLDREP